MSIVELKKVRNFVNLAVGNNQRYSCKTRGVRKRITLSIITGYLVFFAIGLFIGDISASQAINVENAVSMISTVMIASLGSTILYNCYLNVHKNYLLALGVVAIMGAQVAYLLDLFVVPIVNSMFQFATIVSMIILYGLSQKEKNEN
jgi:hypothetical protein